MADTKTSGRRALVASPVRQSLAKWTKAFLSELAATSNVSAAARKAKISTTTAYDTRRADPEFSRKWLSALCEGYDHLEMELLHRLRTGEVKHAASAKRGSRNFDNATALRLLAAHRESAARQRAIVGNQDSARILVSINTKLDKMRERKLLAASEVVIDAGE